MTLGVVQYLLGSRRLGDAGLASGARGIAGSCGGAIDGPRSPGAWSASALALVVGIGGYTGLLPITPTQISDAAGVFLLLSTVGFFGWLFFSAGWTAGERKRLYVIGVLFLAAALFWSVFEQAGSTLNLFADRNTDNRCSACRSRAAGSSR